METRNVEGNDDRGRGIKNRYLEELHSDFSLLSEIVLTQMVKAQELVHDNHNEDILGLIGRNEKIINTLDITIKEKVINAIMLFTPRAVDLRRLMAYYDMTISMERVGDLVENITEVLVRMDFELSGFGCYRKLIDKMFGHANKMVKDAVFAFSGVNHEMAYSTIMMDDKVDRLERKIDNKLAMDFEGTLMEKQALVNMMMLNSLSYYLERIGDKAVDIAESAVYLIEGIDIRHENAQRLKDVDDDEIDEEEDDNNDNN